MATLQAPRTARDRISRAYWLDGSLDFFIGVALVGIAVVWLLDLIALVAVVPAAVTLLWKAFRDAAIAPRMGYVKFDRQHIQEQNSSLLKLLAAGAVLALVMIAIVWWPDRGVDGPARTFAPAIPLVIIATAGLSAGLLFSLPRLAVHGLVSLICAAAVVSFSLDPGPGILVLGVIVLASGLVRLLRFIGQYPKPPGTFE